MSRGCRRELTPVCAVWSRAACASGGPSPSAPARRREQGPRGPRPGARSVHDADMTGLGARPAGRKRRDSATLPGGVDGIRGSCPPCGHQRRASGGPSPFAPAGRRAGRSTRVSRPTTATGPVGGHLDEPPLTPTRSITPTNTRGVTDALRHHNGTTPYFREQTEELEGGGAPCARRGVSSARQDGRVWSRRPEDSTSTGVDLVAQVLLSSLARRSRSAHVDLVA